MASQHEWLFTKEQLKNSISRKRGVDENVELLCRQQAATFILDMGKSLKLSQFIVCQAIVYMHRFYGCYSVNEVQKMSVSVCALFLSAKADDQRSLKKVVKCAFSLLQKEVSLRDSSHKEYFEHAYDLVRFLEYTMLDTLGFNLLVELPHQYVIMGCQIIRAPSDVAKTAYHMATNSLIMTTMCLQYKPAAVACMCIHLSTIWHNWKIINPTNGKEWFRYVESTMTVELLEELTTSYLFVLEKSPSQMKEKLRYAG